MRKSLRISIGVAIVAIAAVLSLFEPTSRFLKRAAGMYADGPPPAGVMQVRFMDVGNADCILIRADGYTVMIDAGENDDEDAVLNELRRQGVERIDLLIATHADADHIGGMDGLVRGMQVVTLMHALSADTADADVIALMRAVEERGVPTLEPVLLNTYTVGGMQLEILGPAAAFRETNDRSLVFRLTFGTVTFLFTGDASSVAEDAMMERGLDLSADVLKISHHGSGTATSEKFLRAVDPSVAVVSCGDGNRHGHPHKKVLGRLSAQNIDLFRTDLDGTVILETDGRELRVVSPIT